MRRWIARLNNPHPLLYTKAPICNPETKPCLFNIKWDPCEYHNLADFMPNTLKVMIDRLKFYYRKSAPAVYPQADESANPDQHGGVWAPWRDKPDIDLTMNDYGLSDNHGHSSNNSEHACSSNHAHEPRQTAAPAVTTASTAAPITAAAPPPSIPPAVAAKISQQKLDYSAQRPKPFRPTGYLKGFFQHQVVGFKPSPKPLSHGAQLIPDTVKEVEHIVQEQHAEPAVKYFNPLVRHTTKRPAVHAWPTQQSFVPNDVQSIIRQHGFTKHLASSHVEEVSLLPTVKSPVKLTHHKTSMFGAHSDKTSTLPEILDIIDELRCRTRMRPMAAVSRRSRRSSIS
ncbi:hypothetical protein OS493_011316 [Desmophyllum pertusum]|uniref:Uncharacterized protein n=1 Tax=Desmophyllum pertusum TaxID=174260 RepID=A0A9X0CRU4_9CNID|nr:hypothetical protein OS493_011316 [Desmophyllum pertusum]